MQFQKECKLLMPVLFVIVLNMYLYFLFQSYALYITGDENATSTDVSKYLAKISAGIFFQHSPWGSL